MERVHVSELDKYSFGNLHQGVVLEVDELKIDELYSLSRPKLDENERPPIWFALDQVHFLQKTKRTLENEICSGFFLIFPLSRSQTRAI
jgi:hypothetical protein